MTKNISVIVATVLLAAGMSLAHGQASDKTSYDTANTNKITTNSTDENRSMATQATHYRTRQQAFEQKAGAEMQEWQRRSQNIVGPAAKYPRPVDSSMRRYEYFNHEAELMGQKAMYFETLSETAQRD
jgi:hypothetical protein